MLWEFQTEAAKQNLGWVLTVQRKSNNSLPFRVQSQDANTVAVAHVCGPLDLLLAVGCEQRGLLRQH